jgi:hypothetical protein
VAIHIEDYDQIIDGSGANNITSVLEEAIKLAQEDSARIKIYFRVKETGTPSLRKINEFRFDPGVSSIEDVKRQIVQKLNEDPGPEFSGVLRIELQNASNSTQYGSYQRSIKIGVLASDQVAYESDEDAGSFNSVSAMFSEEPRPSRADRDEIISMYEKQLLSKDSEMRSKNQQIDAAMGFLFRMLSEQQKMFDRATRMMENYTLRFGFPGMMPGMDPYGSMNREPAPAPAPAPSGGGGDGGLGLLPMLIKMAGQLAGAGGGGAPPAPQAPPPPPRPQGRMGGVMAGAQAVGSMRPRPARPADGMGPPPPMPSQDEGARLHQIGDMPMREERHSRQLEDRRRYHHPEPEQPEEDDGYEADYGGDDGDGGDDGGDGGDDAGGGAALSQFNNLDPDSMKQLVLGWVRASPENKAAAMDMGMELVSEITGG